MQIQIGVGGRKLCSFLGILDQPHQDGEVILMVILDVLPIGLVSSHIHHTILAQTKRYQFQPMFSVHKKLKFNIQSKGIRTFNWEFTIEGSSVKIMHGR